MLPSFCHYIGHHESWFSRCTTAALMTSKLFVCAVRPLQSIRGHSLWKWSLKKVVWGLVSTFMYSRDYISSGCHLWHWQSDKSWLYLDLRVIGDGATIIIMLQRVLFRQREHIEVVAFVYNNTKQYQLEKQSSIYPFFALHSIENSYSLAWCTWARPSPCAI